MLCVRVCVPRPRTYLPLTFTIVGGGHGALCARDVDVEIGPTGSAVVIFHVRAESGGDNGWLYSRERKRHDFGRVSGIETCQLQFLARLLLPRSLPECHFAAKFASLASLWKNVVVHQPELAGRMNAPCLFVVWCHQSSIINRHILFLSVYNPTA